MTQRQKLDVDRQPHTIIQSEINFCFHLAKKVTDGRVHEELAGFGLNHA